MYIQLVAIGNLLSSTALRSNLRLKPSFWEIREGTASQQEHKTYK